MKILIIDDILPDPSFGVGFPRAYQIVLALSSLGHEILFYQTYSERFNLSSKVNKKALQTYKITIIDELPLEAPDCIIISRPHNMFFYKDLIKEIFPNTKLIYDMEALWYRRFNLQSEITGEMPMMGAAYLKYDELGMAQQAGSCIVVNEQEKAILLEKGIEQVHILGHTVKCNRKGKNFDERENFLIIGGNLESGSANEDSTHWFIQNCWPKIKKSNLIVTGMNPTDRIKQAATEDVNFVGFAPKLEDYYQGCRVCVTATRFSTGIPLKVIEAMANGIPCVISKLLAEQLGIEDEALIAEKEEDFIRVCNELYNDKNLWDDVRKRAFDFTSKNYNPRLFKQKLKEILS
jgi:hypothetical protein